MLRCFFSPAGSTTISSVPKQTLRASPFRSARTLSHCHSHHFLCMANSACTDEVTHQHGFTLYDFSQTISMLQQLSFHVMSVAMHRPCMTSQTCVKPTAKHLSLFRHGHLRCLPCCLKHLMEGTEIYAMSAIKLQNDMICTCFNYAELMFANVHTRTDT